MAEVEDRMWYYLALHRHVGRSLLSQLKRSAAKVLDAGCGTGGLLRGLKNVAPTWQFTGLDFSSLACDLARERTGVEIVQGSIAAMPFADASFDAVVSCDVLCQIADTHAALREIYRCLHPSGIVVLTMPAYQWMYSYHDREVANLRRYSRNEVNTLLGGSGFEILGSTYWNMLPFPLAVVRRKILRPADSKSDVRLYPAPVEKCFNGLMNIERAMLRAGFRLPFGSSVLTVAKKV